MYFVQIAVALDAILLRRGKFLCMCQKGCSLTGNIDGLLKRPQGFNY